MKKITTDQIIDPGHQQGFTGLSLAFLQDATAEVVAATVQTIIGAAAAANTPYILYGCVKTNIGGGNFSYTAGYFFYNDEIYSLAAIASIAIATSDVCSITITNDPTADPAPFSDGTTGNVHNIRKVTIADAAPVTNGATQFNFSSAISLQKAWTTYNIPNGKVTATGGGFSSQSGKFRYKMTSQNTLSWYMTLPITTTGTTSAIEIDMSDVFVLNGSGITFYQMVGGENLVLSQAVRIIINAGTSDLQIETISGASLPANTYSFFASGTIDVS